MSVEELETYQKRLELHVSYLQLILFKKVSLIQEDEILEFNLIDMGYRIKRLLDIEKVFYKIKSSVDNLKDLESLKDLKDLKDLEDLEDLEYFEYFEEFEEFEDLGIL